MQGCQPEQEEEEQLVDLSQVDVREQERLLAAIAPSRAGGDSAGRAPGSGGGRLRQGSIRAFLSVRHS